MRMQKDAVVEAPAALLPRILNECQQSQTCHRRDSKELVKCRRKYKEDFRELWCRCMLPLFATMKKEATVERLVKFVVSFVTYRDEEGEECDAFVENFIAFLVSNADAAERSARYRSCQLLSEVVLLLAEDAEISSKIWEAMTSCLQKRLQDKISAVRVFSARALGRLSMDNDNSAIISKYRQALSADSSADVRKTVVMSMPASNSTMADVVERTSDVADSVRKASFSVLGNKFPIQSLSIRQRTVVLQRGLSDRVNSVQSECLKMLKDEWLMRDCKGDVIDLLRYLDVETNEKVGAVVMKRLLECDCIKPDNRRSLRDYLLTQENQEQKVKLMEPEEALYWRMICVGLHADAQAKGDEGATAHGTKADLLEAEASEKTEILERILPPTVADFIMLIEEHYHAGHSHRFAARQLLMLANVFEFTDTSNRKVAGGFIRNVLHGQVVGDGVSIGGGKELDTMEVVGDGVSIAGGKEWSDAIVEFALKVHASPGAFQQAIAEIVCELALPCREGGADLLQWLQCLAVTGLLLENIQHLGQIPVGVIEARELQDGLLIPSVKHLHPDVQRAGIRCLGLFCEIEDKPSRNSVLEIVSAATSATDHIFVKLMAVKGIFDLIMRIGATSLDKIRGLDSSEPQQTSSSEKEIPILEVLMNMLLQNPIDEDDVDPESETVTSVVAEGFTKILIQSKLFPEIQSLQETILSKLLTLYFSDDTACLPRLRQCLSVFFKSYASIEPAHKECIANVFVPVMRSEWPGVSGSSGNSYTATTRKKCATQLARFMVDLVKQPLYVRPKSAADSETQSQPLDAQEKLALSLAMEVLRVSLMKSATVKAYRSTLCKLATSMQFLPSHQSEIKCMRKLTDEMAELMCGEKLILKEIKAMCVELKNLDRSSDDVFDFEEMKSVLDSLGLKMSEKCNEEIPKTPVTVRTKATAQKKKKKEEVTTPMQMQMQTKMMTSGRAQRKCKSEAMKRMQESSKLHTKSRALHFSSSSSSSSSEDDDE